jgi:hypothetical protein
MPAVTAGLVAIQLQEGVFPGGKILPRHDRNGPGFARSHYREPFDKGTHRHRSTSGRLAATRCAKVRMAWRRGRLRARIRRHLEVYPLAGGAGRLSGTGCGIAVLDPQAHWLAGSLADAAVLPAISRAWMSPQRAPRSQSLSSTRILFVANLVGRGTNG